MSAGEWNEYETLQVTLDANVLCVGLNRPRRLNAFTHSMRDDLLAVFRRAGQDDAVRVVIVHGVGMAFCIGMDLEAGPSTFDVRDRVGLSEFRDEGGEVALAIFECPKPVLAAMHGAAVGVGVTMTLPMDVRIASEDARFGFVFARRGVTLESCSSWFLPRIVGIGKALEWALTGRVFDAKEALDAGLVSRVVPRSDLLEETRKLAREIADNTSAVSVALCRRMLWTMLGADHPRVAHLIDSRGMYCMGSTADAAEGVASLLQKRPPSFTMQVSRDLPKSVFGDDWPKH
jgi:enoyl-CoA hydratase/carnithine racemase